MELSIQERLKDLRVERGLTLEQLEEQVNLSKSALGSYEAKDFKDISHYAIIKLAKFYGVTADYLLGRSQTKNHPNADLADLRLSDDMIELLKSGRVDTSLLCELAVHPDFPRLMADLEIYVNGIAGKQVQSANAIVDAVSTTIMKQHNPGLTDPQLRQLMLPWANRYLNNEDFVLVLGRGLAGLVTVNLATTPHILLGGSTGSGKSVLLKLLVMESIKKGAVVCVADFKGGVDYPAVWHEYCRFCFTLEELVPLLDELLAILEERKRLFKNVGCANLGEYNAATNEDLPRYIFACDEVAEVLDKTGLNKEQKEQVAQVESRLATIARQGRAFGIHLILATQRPDANILAGQIKNNIDCRICGRADNVLSQIILDSTDAADRIPKTSRGRFLLHDGTVFQAFLFDDKTI